MLDITLAVQSQLVRAPTRAWWGRRGCGSYPGSYFRQTKMVRDGESCFVVGRGAVSQGLVWQKRIIDRWLLSPPKMRLQHTCQLKLVRAVRVLVVGRQPEPQRWESVMASLWISSGDSKIEHRTRAEKASSRRP